jgi:hypothetical protein
MRTKALFAAATMLAAGIATTLAQSNVYSLNVVGYVNVPIRNGFTLLANPLNAATNDLNTLFPNAGFGDTVYLNSGGGFSSSTYFGSWSPNLALPPGQGAFYSSGAAATNTFVGEVMQGSLSNPIPAAFSLKSSQVPQAATLSTLNFPANFGDTVYFLRNGAYSSSTFFGSWSPDETVAVGESFWVSTATAGNWTRNFTVQ